MNNTGLEYLMRNENASKAAAKLYLNADLADVNFEFAQDGEIIKVPANKANLAAISPVFFAMFFGEIKEKGDVSITDTSIDAFKEFLQFFYLSEPKLTMTNMKEVVKLADKYDILSCVVDSAEDFINSLTLENVCWAFQLAIMVKSEKLELICEIYIKAFTKDILQSTTFGHCDHEVLMVILQMEELDVTEIDILDACLKWAKNSCERDGVDATVPSNLRQKLGKGFEMIRFPLIDPKIFSKNCNEVYEKMFTQEEVVDVFKSFIDLDYTSKIFSNVKRDTSDSVEFYSFIRYLFPNDYGSYRNQEVKSKRSYETCFTTNCPVRLDEFATCPLRRNASGNFNLSLTASLFEFDDPSFEESVGRRKVWEESIKKTGHGWCEFSPFCLINPHKMYKISIEILGNDHENYVHYKSIRPRSVNKLNNRLTVSFHERKPIDGEQIDSNIFSSLRFSYP